MRSRPPAARPCLRRCDSRGAAGGLTQGQDLDPDLFGCKTVSTTPHASLSSPCCKNTRWSETNTPRREEDGVGRPGGLSSNKRERARGGRGEGGAAAAAGRGGPRGRSRVPLGPGRPTSGSVPQRPESGPGRDSEHGCPGPPYSQQPKADATLASLTAVAEPSGSNPTVEMTHP